MGMTLNMDLINESETNVASPAPPPPLSAQKLQEQHEAEMRLNERKAKARKKEEAKKKAQRDRLERERKDIDGELKQTIGANDESMEKKITKIKKKFDKKLHAARSEIDDLHEVSVRQRERALLPTRSSLTLSSHALVGVRTGT
jgi:hypothetical protein